jgi:hypothetical protein
MADTNVSAGRQLVRTVTLGVISAALYLLLYLFEGPLLQLSSQGGWYFVIPIGIAFGFSSAHGAFTGGFWDVLGIKAKK